MSGDATEGRKSRERPLCDGGPHDGEVAWWKGSVSHQITLASSAENRWQGRYVYDAKAHVCRWEDVEPEDAEQ